MSRFDKALWLLVLGPIFLVAACGTSGEEASAEADPAEPPPEDIVELIETYLASWEAKDEQVLRASVTDDFVINEYIYSEGTGKNYETINDDADGVVSEGFGYSWQNEVVDDWAVSGDGPWTVRFREFWHQGTQHLDGIATYTVVDEGGTLKIARHSWAGFTWFEV